MTGRRILVVEDNAIIAMETVERLKRLGFAISGVAATGADAIRLFGTTDPDLVLMDINLKGEMDGIEAAQKIVAQRPLPVIYVTAYSDEETVKRAMASRPFRYLVKPYRERDLYTALEQALRTGPVPAAPGISQESRSFISALASCGDGVIVVGRGGTVRYLNAQAGRITEWTQEALAGRPLADVMTIAAKEPAAMTGPCATGSVTTPAYPCTLTTPRGTKIPACVVMAGPDPARPDDTFTLAVFWMTGEGRS